MIKRILAAALLSPALLATAPAQAAGLSCEYSNNGFLCEAWPQAPGYTYSWDVTGNLYFPDPGHPENPFRNVACTGGAGVVYVTVTTPSGTESTHRNVQCSAGGWPYSPR